MISDDAHTVLYLDVEPHPIFQAAEMGNLAVIQRYIAEGNSVNATSLAKGKTHGATPLHTAVEAKQPEAARLLIAAGADVNAETWPYAETPLLSAILNEDIDMIRLLLDADAHVDVLNSDGETPLHVATYMAFPEGGGRILLEASASTHYRTFLESGTPLFLCAYYWKQSVECARLLLAAGADINAVEEYGRTPLDYAGEGSELYKLLRKHGGKTKAELESENKGSESLLAN